MGLTCIAERINLKIKIGGNMKKSKKLKLILFALIMVFISGIVKANPYIVLMVSATDTGERTTRCFSPLGPIKSNESSQTCGKVRIEWKVNASTQIDLYRSSKPNANRTGAIIAENVTPYAENCYGDGYHCYRHFDWAPVGVTWYYEAQYSANGDVSIYLSP